VAAPLETTTAKLKSAASGIIAVVGWLALAVPFYVGLYACSEWLTPEPFATAAECHRALAYLQYHDGHHAASGAPSSNEEGGARWRTIVVREPIAASCPDSIGSRLFSAERALGKLLDPQIFRPLGRIFALAVGHSGPQGAVAADLLDEQRLAESFSLGRGEHAKSVEGLWVAEG
jgi:hypothetical protein